MNIVVCLPESQEGMMELQKRMAHAHVEMIKDYIQKLPWESGKKVTLYNLVKEEIKRRAEYEAKVSDCKV